MTEQFILMIKEVMYQKRINARQVAAGCGIPYSSLTLFLSGKRNEKSVNNDFYTLNSNHLIRLMVYLEVVKL